MNQPLISIIIPCYNQAQYLDECLQSVLSQTYQNWECIIVNDGSPDDTEEVAKKWVEKDTRFIYVTKQNGGVASARNFGIEKAKGEWILPLDGDDKIGAEYLKKACEKIDEGYDIIYCHAHYFGAKNEKMILPPYSFTELLKQNMIFCTALYSKKRFSETKYDESMSHGLEDWEFWISCLSKVENAKVIQLEDSLFYYRIKAVSRNEDLINDKEKLEFTKLYILNKHYKTYLKFVGSYHELMRKNSVLLSDNDYYRGIVSSKRFSLMNSLFNQIDNFKKKIKLR